MKVTCIFLVVLIRAFVCSAIAEDDSPKPIMVSERDGWWQKVTGNAAAILSTDDGGQHWRDVTPPALTQAIEKKHPTSSEGLPITDLAALNAEEAWVAINEDPDNDQDTVLIEHTSDSGKNWRQTKVFRVLNSDLKLSFVNNRDGFMLGLSGPAAGSMAKAVYRTKDGGEHWDLVAAQGNTAQRETAHRAEDGNEPQKPPAELPANGCYPTGITFRTPLVGWITATYHGGEAAPLYRTKDGGNTWNSQELPLPGNDRTAYADVYPPVFVGSDKQWGCLPVKYVGHSNQGIAWFNYESNDGGESWHLPVAGVPFFKEE